MAPGIFGIASIGYPVADQRPSERSYHGKVMWDDYLWLKDSSYPGVDDEDILAYLQQENRWYEQQMARRQALVDPLVEEMKGRIEDHVTEVPWRHCDYFYRWRLAPESQYRAHGGSVISVKKSEG